MNTAMPNTIPMEGATKRFYQGVSAGSQVTDAHASTEFPNDEVRVNLYWFYVGALAAGEYECESAEDFTGFILGAQTRAPQTDDDNDKES